MREQGWLNTLADTAEDAVIRQHTQVRPIAVFSRCSQGTLISVGARTLPPSSPLPSAPRRPLPQP
jgi:hypothetical protein